MKKIWRRLKVGREKNDSKNPVKSLHSKIYSNPVKKNKTNFLYELILYRYICSFFNFKNK